MCFVSTQMGAENRTDPIIMLKKKYRRSNQYPIQPTTVSSLELQADKAKKKSD